MSLGTSRHLHRFALRPSYQATPESAETKILPDQGSGWLGALLSGLGIFGDGRKARIGSRGRQRYSVEVLDLSYIGMYRCRVMCYKQRYR